MRNKLITWAGVLWTSPNTFLGLMIGLANLAFGGNVRFRVGAVECYGGGVRRMLRSLPTGPNTAGMTLGHVILGQTAEGLERVSNHERVHVAQYCRWGPFFLPAYALSSVWAWLHGKDPYRGNVFEVEAYRVEG